MTKRFFRFKGCPQTGLPYPGARGPFLETQVICRARNEVFTVKAWVLASKLLHFVSLTDSFILLDANLLKPFSCMQTTTVLRALWLSGLPRLAASLIQQLQSKWKWYIVPFFNGGLRKWYLFRQKWYIRWGVGPRDRSYTCETLLNSTLPSSPGIEWTFSQRTPPKSDTQSCSMP